MFWEVSLHSYTLLYQWLSYNVWTTLPKLWKISLEKKLRSRSSYGIFSILRLMAHDSLFGYHNVQTTLPNCEKFLWKKITFAKSIWNFSILRPIAHDWLFGYHNDWTRLPNCEKFLWKKNYVGEVHMELFHFRPNGNGNGIISQHTTY